MKAATAAPKSVNAYIKSCPPAVRRILTEIRRTVRAVAPEAEERLSYRMPALFQDGVVIYYAAFAKHIGVFPPVPESPLRKRLARYTGPKGNLQFPLDEPVPYALIGRVAKARLTENRRRAAAKRKARR